jgi:hypothetical protein
MKHVDMCHRALWILIRNLNCDGMSLSNLHITTEPFINVYRLRAYKLGTVRRSKFKVFVPQLFSLVLIEDRLPGIRDCIAT